jgi:hypothetical protein
MKQWHILLLRWLAWTLLVAFESVVGFPWLSMFVAAGWLFSFGGDASIAVAALMAPVLAAVYGIPLVGAMLLLLGLRQLMLYTRRNTWQRWAAIVGVSLAAGLGGGTTFSVSAILFTLISAGIFFAASKNVFFQKLWHTKTLHRSFE